MSNKLSRLARLAGDDLSQATFADEAVLPAVREYKEVTGSANISSDMPMPVLGDGPRALLIMSGCQAKFVGNYWHVTRRTEPGQAPPGTHLRPGQKYRMSTGVAVNADDEEWRKALADFVGGIGK